MRQLPHPSPQEIALPAVLAALSDPVRLAIVARLARRFGEHGWGDFADLGVAPATLSHHMKTLRLAGVIAHRKEGTSCYVSLRPDLDRALPGLLPPILKLAPKRR